jgi:hypothetical protein
MAPHGPETPALVTLDAALVLAAHGWHAAEALHFNLVQK